MLPVLSNPLNAELNPICHLLALLGAHPIFHISGIRVNINPKVILWLAANVKTTTIRVSKESVITVYSGNDYDSSLPLGCDIV